MRGEQVFSVRLRRLGFVGKGLPTYDLQRWGDGRPHRVVIPAKAGIQFVVCGMW